MEWKLFEKCKGHSWECDIHELKDLGGGRGFLFISRGCGGREGIERFVKNVPRNSHYPPAKDQRDQALRTRCFLRRIEMKRLQGKVVARYGNRRTFFLPSFLPSPSFASQFARRVSK